MGWLLWLNTVTVFLALSLGWVLCFNVVVSVNCHKQVSLGFSMHCWFQFRFSLRFFGVFLFVVASLVVIIIAVDCWKDLSAK